MTGGTPEDDLQGHLQARSDGIVFAPYAAAEGTCGRHRAEKQFKERVVRGSEIPVLTIRLAASP